MDLIWLDGAPILHIVDTHTHYQNAVFIRSNRAEDIWYASVEGWASLYLGYPNVIRLDQEDSFCSNFFKDVSVAHGIDLRFSGVEAHNSIGPEEMYQDPLRRIYRAARHRYPSPHPQILLRYVVKSINDSMGPEGIVPLLLVYVTMPTFPLTIKDLPGQEDLMASMRWVREEVEMSCPNYGSITRCVQVSRRPQITI